ncbi:MAG TPA: GNAT family N-acetyltransferase [Vicinamibacteria bacterium]
MTGILTTERLALREMVPADLDFVADMLADPEVMRYYPKTYSRSEAQEWLDRQRTRYLRDGHALWLVSSRASGEAVGQIGVVRQTVRGVDYAEVGYLLARAFWGQGLATEAARACRDHAFQALGRAQVISLIRPENLPSCRVAERMDMKVVDRVPHWGYDHLVYAISRQEVGS